MRKAKVGGYRDYFDDEQIAMIDDLVKERRLPAYGYTEEESSALTVADAGSAA